MKALRIDYYKVSPKAVKAMMGLEEFVTHCGLDKKLMELIKLRASQINGCAFCVDYHCADALKAGEIQKRLDAVAVWHESTLFTALERSVLAWTEAVTLLSETRAPDNLYQDLFNYFSEEEIVNLTMTIVTINSWNRLAVSFRMVP